MIAELQHVTKRFGAVVALDDVDLAFGPGAITALLGPNGAGKTTTARLLLGLTAPTRGTVRVFGGDPRRTATRARVGAMLQVGKVPETLRVREHIDLFRSYYPRPLPARAAVEAAGLAGLENRMFGTLSGGQRQRVLFALALCGNPDLLVLDEPTVGLDVESRRALWDGIRALAAAGRAVLLTTHYLDEADALAHRIVVVSRGAIAADGTPAEIKARVARRVIRCVTTLSLDAVRDLAGPATVRREDGMTEIVTPHAEAIVRELLARDPALSGLEIRGAGLEEAFLAITAGSGEGGGRGGDGVKGVTSIRDDNSVTSVDSVSDVNGVARGVA